MLLRYLVIIALLKSLPVFANTNIQERLIDLRAKVQFEADQLDSEKKLINASVQSLAVEKGELESQRKLLLDENRQLKKALIEKNKIMGGEELKDMKGYREIVDSGAKALMTYFKASIPFKTNKRMHRIKELQNKFKNKDITIAEYFEKYWSFLQDEIRLSEDVEIQSDTIRIGDKDHKVKVLRLGMIGLYFKSLDGQIGFAAKKGSSWSFEFFKNSKLSKGVELLFSAKEKQIKGGTYHLPLQSFNEVTHAL